MKVVFIIFTIVKNISFNMPYTTEDMEHI